MSKPKFSYVLSDEARFDIDEIWDYIAQDSPDAADRYIDELHHVFSLLAANPLMGREREELETRLRQLPYENYNLFYRPTDGGVEIYRVLHGARDTVQIFDKPIDMLDETI